MYQGSEAVARARAAVGARFRLHGRDAAGGLDCVGLAALAYGVSAPCGYALRGGTVEATALRIARAGFARVEAMRPGDLMLIGAGVAQLHLGIATDRGFVHAHAGLRRVVETPGRPDGPVLALFRLEGD